MTENLKRFVETDYKKEGNRIKWSELNMINFDIKTIENRTLIEIHTTLTDIVSWTEQRQKGFEWQSYLDIGKHEKYETKYPGSRIQVVKCEVMAPW